MKNLTNLTKLAVFAVSFIFLGMAATVDASACGMKCNTSNMDKASKTVSPEDAKTTTNFLASDAISISDDENHKAEETKKGEEKKCGEGKCGESKKNAEAKKATEEGKKGEEMKCGEGKCG